MTRLLIGVPVLNRPANAAPLVTSLSETTAEATLLFLLSPEDRPELLAVDELLAERVRGQVMPFGPGRGDFARKHNFGFALALAEGFDWYFVGADDLRFHPGWFEACMLEQRKSDACVIGTNDLGNVRTSRGQHSTHFLVHTDYLECGTVDEPGKLFHERYWHEFTDDECVQTAKVRRTYAHAHNAIVEHLHPDWHKAARDSTYELAQAHRREDSALYHSRKSLWGRR